MFASIYQRTRKGQHPEAYQATAASKRPAITATPELVILPGAPLFGALVAEAVVADAELDPVGLVTALALMLDVILVEPVELELPVVVLDVIVDILLLPEVVEEEEEEAEVVLLAEVDEVPVLLAVVLALLELEMEATVLLDSMTNCGV